VSANGTICAGTYNDSDNLSHPCWWDATNTVQTLPQMPGSNLSSGEVRGINPAITMMCGITCDSMGSQFACVWRLGVIEVLPLFPDSVPFDQSFAAAISEDGNTVFGRCDKNFVTKFVFWKYLPVP